MRGLDAADLDRLVFLLTREAIWQQQRAVRGEISRALPRWAERALDQAADRAHLVVKDAADAGLAVSAKVAVWLTQVHKPRIRTYAGSTALISFLRDDCRVPVDERLLHDFGWELALFGNYSAFLRLLHEALSADSGLRLGQYTVTPFLKAVAGASLRNSEDLGGYPKRPLSIADLAVPGWAAAPRYTGMQMTTLPEEELHPLEREADTVSALRDAVSEAGGVKLQDLCLPDMPPGSVTAVQKTLQILQCAMGLHRSGSAAQVLTSVGLCSALEGFVRAKHPRLALAAAKLFTSEPFLVPPTSAHVALLACDARDRHDGDALAEVVDLADRMVALGMQPERDLYAAFASAFGRTGRPDRAREYAEKMVASGEGARLGSQSGMAMLDAALEPRTTLEEAKKILAGLESVGIANVRHVLKVANHFADRGDVRSVEALLEGIAPAGSHGVTAVHFVAKAYGRAGDVPGLFAALGRFPRDLLSRPDASRIWSTVIKALARGHRFEELFALCSAVLDRKPVDPAAHPGMPLAGLGVPDDRGPLVIAVDHARRCGRGRREVLQEKARRRLAADGFDAAGLDLDGMHVLLRGRVAEVPSRPCDAALPVSARQAAAGTGRPRTAKRGGARSGGAGIGRSAATDGPE
ncbi:hypothetical protein DFJ74DRAFT_773771 [Hyaloraphidium curvatum]|nr:hypothetical protein DFJ74DRAFT_773771 [Hyaloraphidium curvatum]